MSMDGHVCMVSYRILDIHGHGMLALGDVSVFARGLCELPSARSGKKLIRRIPAIMDCRRWLTACDTQRDLCGYSTVSENASDKHTHTHKGGHPDKSACNTHLRRQILQLTF